MFYKPKHFQPYELVDRATFERFKGDIWFLFRPELLISLDGVRDFFDKAVTVNNWHEGGEFDQRGLRILNEETKKIYSPYSQHSLANGADLDVEGMGADEVRSEILGSKDDARLANITCFETGITWVHIDCRNIANRILLIPG